MEKRRLEKKLRTIIDERERAAAAEVGGSPQQPVEASSAATVEGRARSLGCIHCPGQMQVVAHDAVTVEGARLRRVSLACKECHATRQAWVRLR